MGLNQTESKIMRVVRAKAEQQMKQKLDFTTADHKSLKVYKDGKVIAHGGGLALNSKKGHRLHGQRSIGNLLHGVDTIKQLPRDGSNDSFVKR